MISDSSNGSSPCRGDEGKGGESQFSEGCTALGSSHCLPTAIPLSMLHPTDMSVLFPPASIPLQLLLRAPSPPREAALSRAALGLLLQGHG